MAPCNACRRNTMVLDSSLGAMCCTSCGVVGEADDFGGQSQVGMVMDRGGVNVTDDGRGALMRLGGRFTNSTLDWKTRKYNEAVKTIREVTQQIGMGESRLIDVQDLVRRSTADEWGTGRWMRILTGACSYIVARNEHLALTLPEVAYAVDCDVFELGRMLHKVVSLLELELQMSDPVVLIEKLLSLSETFTDRDQRRKVLDQCKVLFEFLKECCVTTGRHIGPVVAAVFFVVSQANGADVPLEEIASGLNVTESTSLKRYRELQDALLKTLHSVSFCKGIAAADLRLHYNFVIEYIKLKSKRSKLRQKLPEDEPQSKKQRVMEEPAASVLPKSFILSSEDRQRRLVKMRAASERIAATKKALLASAATPAAETLDKEDLIIEYLLMRNVEPGQIEQGYYDSLMAALRTESEDGLLSEKEINTYLRKDEKLAELIQQLKSAPQPERA